MIAIGVVGLSPARADSGSGDAGAPAAETTKPRPSGATLAIVMGNVGQRPYVVPVPGRHGKSPTMICRYFDEVAYGPSTAYELPTRLVPASEGGPEYTFVCVDPAIGDPLPLDASGATSRRTRYNPGNPAAPLSGVPGMTALDQILREIAIVELPPLKVATSPDHEAGRTQILGVPTWFWIASEYEQREASTRPIDGYVGVMTPGPPKLSWHVDGDVGVRDDACDPRDAKVWSAGMPEDLSPCRFTIWDAPRDRSGRVTVTFRLTYDLRWSLRDANGAETGIAGDYDEPLVAEQDVVLPVTGLQAVGRG
jgi:hypothetical protein